MSNPWVKPFVAQRLIEPTTYTELNAALMNSQPFDHISPTFTVEQNITLNRPDTQITVDQRGFLKLSARNTRTFMSNHTNTVVGNIITQEADDTAVINSVVRGNGELGTVGMLSTTGKNQVTYGNIFCGGFQHGLYLQNSADSIEYIAQNYIGDVIPSSNSRTIHAYAESAHKMEMLHFIQNVVANGQALIGGQSLATIPLYNLVQENWFSAADLSIGFKRPACTDIISNRFYNCGIDNQWFYGVGDEPGDTSIVTGNSIYRGDGGYHFRFRTSAYVNGVRQEGLPRIRTSDVWDNNEYWADTLFRCSFNAGGVNHVDVTKLTDFQNYSEAAGKRFDGGSILRIGRPSEQSWLIPNDYDQNRAMLVTYDVAQVTLPRTAEIYRMDGTALGEDDSFTGGVGLNCYLVKYTTPAPPPDPCHDLKDWVKSICNDTTITCQQKIRRIRKVCNDEL